METLQSESVWITRKIYEEAETQFYENLSKASVTPLAGEVAKARQLLIESRDAFVDTIPQAATIDADSFKFFEKKIVEFDGLLSSLLDRVLVLESKVSNIENARQPGGNVHQIDISANKVKDQEQDDDVDLFGSDSDEENDAAAKIREERLAAYNEKKSKKPVLVAKSNVILDVKPWDDETDMKELEASVRKITADGLLWGAAKLVPLAYGIHKLQISCVVEDDKISIDWLQEIITEIEDYVQSVDIAAFNKI